MQVKPTKKAKKAVEAAIERHTRPNPLDAKVEEPAARVFELKKPDGSIVKAVWVQKSELPITRDEYESRTITKGIRITPTVEKILRKRAKKYCGGNVGEWMVWAALEYTPPTQKISVSFD